MDSTYTGNSAMRLMTAGPTSSLVWQEPVAREDGSLLYPSEIAQYHVYYKFTYEKQYHLITIPDGSTTELSLSSFSPGIYDFEVTAVDQQGLESGPSQAVQITVI
ncbi:fibronectin type III domain-containing protein [Mangrovitalea sediminis]|uniref:fibronectin type III domain-containing protein n=1 Tax=Mangrovitalea sediminis TaxID=1982043 RepID=UPI000BE5B668|nr:fibronectin type III domain-containing protein [Mangrovitalea sediminis]